MTEVEGLKVQGQLGCLSEILSQGLSRYSMGFLSRYNMDFLIAFKGTQWMGVKAVLGWSQMRMLPLRVLPLRVLPLRLHWRGTAGSAKGPPSQCAQERSLGSAPLSAWPVHWKQLFTGPPSSFRRTMKNSGLG